MTPQEIKKASKEELIKRYSQLISTPGSANATEAKEAYTLREEILSRMR